ncbi:MAG: extracellular solute-binding protein, partial [Candidatus Eremiobacteraeota bacterium]|nr:extracellular solute-binding protein [Candidatus Eremiobacteraeota bacterium]
VSVLYAGSLVTVVERSIVPALSRQGLNVLGEPKGSVALANLIKAGLRQPDVFISADTAVIAALVGPGSGALVSWYASCAATRLVIGYSPASTFAKDFAAVARGEKSVVSVLSEPGLKLGRTDPALDPKGYRSIVAAKLLEADGGPPNFADRLLGDPENSAQILPEETLLSRLGSGELDAAFLYATESVSAKVPAVELPKTANLGDPAQAAHYATQSVTIKGVTRVGSAAVYALTIPNAAPHKDAAAQFVTFLVSDAGTKLLTAAGVTTLRPHVSGDESAVPAAVLRAFSSTSSSPS